MDPSTKRLTLPEADAQQASAPSALPTPQGAETPPKSPPPGTDDFHHSAITLADAHANQAGFLEPGTLIDGYAVLKLIAETKMSMVYQARQPGTDRLVALKLIQHGALADRESIERFRQEIKTLGQLQPHKNIVPIYHVGQFRNELYYVMPFLPGGSLSSQIDRFQADGRKGVAAIERIARAVHLLHAQEPKILHRDIKPGNILLGPEDEPLLADFGLIKLLDDSQALTRSQRHAGDAGLHGSRADRAGADRGLRTDRHLGIGVVLYELLTGKRPFAKEQGEETAQLLWRIVHKEPARPCALLPDLDAGLDAVVMKCLEKRPEDRFGSSGGAGGRIARGGCAMKRCSRLRRRRRSRTAPVCPQAAAFDGSVGADRRRRRCRG